jgi:hypothetical protein
MGASIGAWPCLGRCCITVVGTLPAMCRSFKEAREVADHTQSRDAQLDRGGARPPIPVVGRRCAGQGRLCNGVHRLGGQAHVALMRRFELTDAQGTVSSRFYRWRMAGVFDRVLQRLQAQADARGDLDWDLHFMGATVVRAHQHAAGARRSGAIGG